MTVHAKRLEEVTEDNVGNLTLSEIYLNDMFQKRTSMAILGIHRLTEEWHLFHYFGGYMSKWLTGYSDDIPRNRQFQASETVH